VLRVPVNAHDWRTAVSVHSLSLYICKREQGHRTDGEDSEGRGASVLQFRALF